MKLVMRQNTSFWALLLAVAVLLSACSSDDTNTTSATSDDSSEIRMDASVWQVMEGTRATTFDDAEALQTAGFKCVVYNDNETTEYITPVNVDWDGDSWEFEGGKRYWPTSGSLDFFAYSPQTLPGNISTLTYATARNPQFTCADLPIALTPADATKEFIWALTTGQDKAGQGVSGVTMTFKHPFARIRFKLSAASGNKVTVNSITIPDIYRDGTCTLTGTGNTAVSTWSSLSDGSSDLVVSGTPATNDDTFYLVIPNNYGSKTLTVNATWSDWGTATKDVSADVSINWKAGNSYTYTLTLSKEGLVVDVNKYTEQW